MNKHFHVIQLPSAELEHMKDQIGFLPESLAIGGQNGFHSFQILLSGLQHYIAHIHLIGNALRAANEGSIRVFGVFPIAADLRGCVNVDVEFVADALQSVRKHH